MAGMDLREALVAGVEQVTAWSGLLDRINVFPVADGDTGRNLMISLAPLRRFTGVPEETARDLLFSARGNAGNIAARFFHALIRAETLHQLPETIKQGRDQAWQAVSDPQPGTMLTFFDGLAAVIRPESLQVDQAWVNGALDELARIVSDTTARQPRLEKAGVVDSGALGMFLFFHGFLNVLAGNRDAYCPVASLFRGRLRLYQPMGEDLEAGYCVDMVLSHDARTGREPASLRQLGESVVVITDGAYLKVHLHTADNKQTRRRIEQFGQVLRWSEDDLGQQTAAFRDPRVQQAIHVMTDAAGSLTRQEAQALDVTLLDSYILLGDQALPESCLTPEVLYGAMNNGMPVATSQASVHERQQAYQSALSLYGKVLYLCVGSVFTGNYAAAGLWKRDHDPDDGLVVMDTGCAAGRLGLLATVTARFAGCTDRPDAVIAFARQAVDRCQEYIFVDRLHYLAAGGRLSKTGAFFGDMMHLKPVISPQADGAQKVGMVRNRRNQVAFALKKLDEALKRDTRSVIWLEYTDNGDWVRADVEPDIKKRYPAAEIVAKPLSLTTGAHTGPGTWAIAFFSEL